MFKVLCAVNKKLLTVLQKFYQQINFTLNNRRITSGASEILSADKFYL
jgi:hypothetical protein